MIVSKNARQPPRHLAAPEKGIRGRCKGLHIFFSKSMEIVLCSCQGDSTGVELPSAESWRIETE